MIGSPEFSLAVECCRRSFPAPSRDLATPALEPIDWHRFIQLVRFHRVEGLAWNALSGHADALPAFARQALSQAAMKIAADNLRASVDCQMITEKFMAEGVPLLFLKGLSLGALAYGNPALKAAIDIDLLIDPDDLRAASRLLRQCGYTLSIPRQSAGDRILHAWHRSWKESVWSSVEGGLQIDLHTRAADNRHMIASIGVHSPLQLVDIGSRIRLPTPAVEELFAYLAVHGASSAWFRLKWVSDFAALLAHEKAARIAQLYRRSQVLGAGRGAGQALLLADALFGTLDADRPLREELKSDRATRLLYRAALRMLGGEPDEPTQRRFGTATIHWTQFLLRPGAPYMMSELFRQANRPLVRLRS